MLLPLQFSFSFSLFCSSRLVEERIKKAERKRGKGREEREEKQIAAKNFLIVESVRKVFFFRYWKKGIQKVSEGERENPGSFDVFGSLIKGANGN